MAFHLENDIQLFPHTYNEILERVQNVNPVKYGSTRNYIDGDVSYLSPYISRGVISTKFVLEELLKKGYAPTSIEKFIQELAWRDYWQQVWISKGEEINKDLRNTQTPISNTAISTALVNANTGIEAIDNSIRKFYETGYLHNHLRMYIAAIACNIAQSHWKLPAKWMYYHLLDADWASNALSWQWVAGANSNKKYYANQENINRYCHTEQTNTFLDVGYDRFSDLNIPEILKGIVTPNLTTPLPTNKRISVEKSKPTLVYNYYNLDPNWNKEMDANRILLLEPSHFERYPISEQSVNFMLDLSQNIKGIKVYTGEFDELVSSFQLETETIHYKEHPLNKGYKGIEESRDWMFEVTGYYRSFFGFWKKCKKQPPFKTK